MCVKALFLALNEKTLIYGRIFCENLQKFVENPHGICYNIEYNTIVVAVWRLCFDFLSRKTREFPYYSNKAV